MNPYEVLGVAQYAPTMEIKAAYRALAKACHPDIGGDPEQFHRINLAYQVLIDPDRRAKYDEHGVIDQEEINDARHAAFDQLAKYFDRCLSTGIAFDKTQNVLGVIKEAARTDRSEAAKTINKVKRNIGLLESLKGRISRKDDDEPNVFTKMVEAHIDGASRQVEKIQASIKVFDLLLDELENYKTIEDAVKSITTARIFYKSSSGGSGTGDTF